ncbi:MAG: PadR family transcriptional regulator [Ornithinibacter sp.]
MSVRSGLLALLAEGDKYGAQLRSEFEARTGGTWPLNVGQVYTTLDRLGRDGLVESAGQPDAEGRIAYRLTPLGHAELGTWWSTPVDRSNTPRDELTIKLALAVTAPDVDVQRVVQTQRTATLRHLHDLTRLKRESMPPPPGIAQARAQSDAASRLGPLAQPSPTGDNGLAWLLVLENLVFAAEAEVRWLDHVETMLARRPARTASRPTGATTPTTTTTATRHQPAVSSSTRSGGDHS